jgi:hypothetical protein
VGVLVHGDGALATSPGVVVAACARAGGLRRLRRCHRRYLRLNVDIFGDFGGGDPAVAMASPAPLQTAVATPWREPGHQPLQKSAHTSKTIRPYSHTRARLVRTHLYLGLLYPS